MAGKHLILVAAHALVGGIAAAKGEAAEPYTLDPGKVLDSAAAKKLGLSSKDIDRLVEQGAVVQQQAFAADSGLPDGQAAPGTTGTKFEGLSLDQMHKFLDEHNIKYPKDANGPDLMKIALDFQHPDAVATSAAEIEKSMDPAKIKAELDKLQVPYESGADKPTLAKALAQARAARG